MIASMCAMAHADREYQSFVVPLPAEWKAATRIRLVLEGVTVPGNRPLKFRVTTTEEDQREVFLGSVGIEALGRSESKARRLPTLRIDITQSLKEFLKNRGGARSLELRIQPVNGRNNPIQDLKWSTDNVRLEASSE